MLQRLAKGLSIAAIVGASMVASWLMPLPAAGQDPCSAVAGPARGVCRAYCGALDCPHGHGGAACDSLRKVWQKHTGSSEFPCDARTATCEPVEVTATHGDGLFVGNLQLGRVVNGKIPCVHSETAEVAECVFNADNVRWLSSPSGTFVPMGQATSLNGAWGEYVTAGQVSAQGTLSCIEPTAADTTGTASSAPLATACMAETLLSARNESGFPLENFADLEVCSTDQVHPDAHAVGPDNTRCFVNPQTSAVNCCWTGEGAALNDPAGRERDLNGQYLSRTSHCHLAMVNPTVAIFAAKRPPQFSASGPILWRPVSPQTFVANGGVIKSRCEAVELTGLHVQGWIPGTNARLARIEVGSKVPCLHKTSLEFQLCDFIAEFNLPPGAASGTFLEGPTGKYALIGQAVPLRANSGGSPDYIVAAEMNAAGNVACTAPGSDRPAFCVNETALSSQNATGIPLINHADQTIQTSSNPHPDAHDGGPTALGCANGICGYTGEGAALNNIFGTERNASGAYYVSTERCHMLVHQGFMVPAAKRALAPDAPLRWLPVDPTIPF